MVGSDFFLTFSGMSGLFLLDDAELLSMLMSPADPLIKLKEDNEEYMVDNEEECVEEGRSSRRKWRKQGRQKQVHGRE